MALWNRKSALSAALAGAAAIGAATSAAFAQEQPQQAVITDDAPSLVQQQRAVANDQQAELTPAAYRSVGLVEDAALQAGKYSETNPGIAVAVFLGTHSNTPSQQRVAEVLTGDFERAGLQGPVTFFFEQNDVAGSGASFYYDGNRDGPFTLAASRDQAETTANTYNFRKQRGLLASLDYNQ